MGLTWESKEEEITVGSIKLGSWRITGEDFGVEVELSSTWEKGVLRALPCGEVVPSLRLGTET